MKRSLPVLGVLALFCATLTGCVHYDAHHGGYHDGHGHHYRSRYHHGHNYRGGYYPGHHGHHGHYRHGHHHGYDQYRSH